MFCLYEFRSTEISAVRVLFSKTLSTSLDRHYLLILFFPLSISSISHTYLSNKTSRTETLYHPRTSQSSATLSTAEFQIFNLSAAREKSAKTEHLHESLTHTSHTRRLTCRPMFAYLSVRCVFFALGQELGVAGNWFDSCLCILRSSTDACTSARDGQLADRESCLIKRETWREKWTAAT